MGFFLHPGLAHLHQEPPPSGHAWTRDTQCIAEYLLLTWSWHSSGDNLHRAVLLWFKDLLVQLFFQAVTRTLTQICLAWGAECVISTFLPVETDRILVVNKTNPCHCFLVPDFQGQNSRNISVVFISKLSWLLWIRECLESVHHCHSEGQLS